MERLAQGNLGSSDKWCNFSCFNLDKFYHWFQKKESWATRKQFGLAIFNFFLGSGTIFLFGVWGHDKICATVFFQNATGDGQFGMTQKT